MIFNQRINRTFAEFNANDYDFNEFKRALNLSRSGTDITLGYSDKVFFQIPDSVFRCQTDDQQRVLGISTSSFMKFAMYAYLQELGKVNDFMNYAKRHGYSVRNTASSFY